MAGIEWRQRPLLDEPVALLAFTGWGDAGEAASQAAISVLDSHDTELLAVIDSDEHYDFQVRRPVTEIDVDGRRSILWPDIEIHAVWGAGRDLVVVVGDEPHYRWKSFSREISGALRSLGVNRAVALGAFIGQVAHTLPVPLIGSSNRPELLAPWGLLPSNYEGPTGIVGVLTNELTAAGIDTLAIWAAVPHYLSNQDYPPGTQALLQKTAELLDLSIDMGEFDDATRQYLSTVDEAIAANSDLIDYVQRLEEEADEVDTEETMRLVSEIEDFLRDQS